MQYPGLLPRRKPTRVSEQLCPSTIAVSAFAGFQPLSEAMQNLAIIYGAVIDDVLSKVRPEFVQKGNE